MGSGAPILKHPTKTGLDGVIDYVEKGYGQQSYWGPSLQAGDVLVFTSMMFHRTQTSPDFSKTRYSLELRGPVKDRTLIIAGVPNDWNEIKMLENIPA